MNYKIYQLSSIKLYIIFILLLLLYLNTFYLHNTSNFIFKQIFQIYYKQIFYTFCIFYTKHSIQKTPK